MMRSLSKAICTSGEPVSFVCCRYFSINPDLTSLKPLSPLRPFFSSFSSSLRPTKTIIAFHCKQKIFTILHVPHGFWRRPLVHQKSRPRQHQSNHRQHHSQRPKRFLLRQQRDRTNHQRRFHQHLRQIESVALFLNLCHVRLVILGLLGQLFHLFVISFNFLRVFLFQRRRLRRTLH